MQAEPNLIGPPGGEFPVEPVAGDRQIAMAVGGACPEPPRRCCPYALVVHEAIDAATACLLYPGAQGRADPRRAGSGRALGQSQGARQRHEKFRSHLHAGENQIRNYLTENGKRNKISKLAAAATQLANGAARCSIASPTMSISRSRTAGATSPNNRRQGGGVRPKPPMMKPRPSSPKSAKHPLKADPEQHVMRLARRSKPHRGPRRSNAWLHGEFRHACRGMRAKTTEPRPMSDRPAQRSTACTACGIGSDFPSCGAPFIPGSTAISATGDEGGTTVGAGVESAGTVIGEVTLPRNDGHL